MLSWKGGREVLFFICLQQCGKWLFARCKLFALSYIQEELLPGGHGLMVRGYLPVVNTLAKGLDVRLGHRYKFPSDPSSSILLFRNWSVT